MCADVVAQPLEETDFPAWTRLVAEAPGGSVYSTPEYLDALCSAAGGSFRIIGARRGADLVGGIAAYERGSSFGPYVSPRLLLYYNGVVLRASDSKYPSERTARAVKAHTALAEALEARYASVNVRSRQLTDARAFVARGWTAVPSYSYVVGIADLPAAWARIEQNLRRLVERAAERGMVLSQDDDFASFYGLHATTMARKDTATYLPRDAFERYFRLLLERKLCRLYQARLPDGRVVAGQLVLLGPHPVAHTVSAASDPEFNKAGASAFLRWKTFEALSALGYAGTDLTDATLNPVTHFKSQLGGDLELTLVVEAPGTRRFRWGTGAQRLLARARGAAGAVLRRVTGPREG